MRIPTLAVLALAAGAPSAAAQAPRLIDTLHLSLEQAVARAMERGEEMKIARAQLDDANGQVREAFSQALPQINGSLTYTRQFASIFQNDATSSGSSDTSITNLFKNSPFGAANAWNISVSASQLLFSAGKVGAALSAARSARLAMTAQRDMSAADVTFQVKQAYFNALYAGRVMAVAQSGLGQAREQLTQVKLYQQQGTRSAYDLLRAQVDAANQEPIVVAARNTYDVAVLELKRLVNIPPEQAVALDTPLEAPDGSIPVFASETLDTLDRPTLAAAEATVSVREALLRVAQADRWPSLSLTSDFSEQAFPQDVSPFAATFRRNWNAAVKLSVPIFQGFRVEGSIQRARAALDEARAERNQIAERAALDLTQARQDMQRAQTLLVARQQTVDQAKRAQQLASLRYGNGLSTQLEVSDARLLAQQAEVNQVQATRDYLVALAQVERVLGHPVPVVRRSLVDVAATLTTQGNQP